jgi:hypothetical protein
VSCLRENLTISSYGEGLETGEKSAPRQSLTRQDWHRVLKSGCAVERIAHQSAERIRRAIAINLVIGWRIMLMTLLGRQTPELPPEVLFSDIELQVLNAYSKKKA